MEKQFFCNILILCSIAIQGIYTLSVENENDILVRKKRLIDLTPFPHLTRNISRVPYIVSIVKNEESFCGATILEANILITAAYCVSEDAANYRILSNSAYRNHGIEHNITNKIIHHGYHPASMSHNIALLVIHPPIDLLRSNNRKIDLFNSQATISPEGTLSGWGCIHLERGHAVYPDILRSITVPIISLRECRRIFRGYDQVEDSEFCTHDPTEKKRSCYGDVGGPLVNRGQLLGVLSWTRVVVHQTSPDVYINLSSPLYREWINLHLDNHRNLF